jgi:ribosomal protein S18 acetylase RimI-like enzyme
MAAAAAALGFRMARIRAYRTDDLDALYRICLATGDAGEDASGLYRDPLLLGHVYAGGYAALCPETIVVAEDGNGVGGYVVGPADTRAFAAALEAQWWPALRARYPDSDGTSPDARMHRRIHHPLPMPDAIVAAYPAHLHINLLPRLQGQGIGRRLMDRWCETVRALGAAGAHLAVGTRNQRAVRFYRAYGFGEIAAPTMPPDVMVLGVKV